MQNKSLRVWIATVALVGLGAWSLLETQTNPAIPDGGERVAAPNSFPEESTHSNTNDRDSRSKRNPIGHSPDSETANKEADCTLKVTVRIDGQPAQVHLRYYAAAFDWRYLDADTDVEGVSILRSLSPGESVIAVGTVRKSVTLLPATRSHVEFELSSESGIEGRVIDPTGRGVANASIRYFAANGAAGFGIATTDAAGSFKASGVSPGDSIGATSRAFGPSLIQRVPAGQGPHSIILTLASANESLHGRVVDDAGVPMAGAHVAIGRQWDNLESSTSRRTPLSQRTDTNGSFQIAGLTTGASYPIWVQQPGYAVAREIVTIDANTSSLLIRLQPGVVVSGSVIDSNDQPVKDAAVWFALGLGDGHIAPFWAQPITSTNAKGNFVLFDQPAVAGTVSASADLGFAEQAVHPRPGDRLDLRLILASNGNVAPLRGQVVDAAGRPLTKARVMIMPKGDGNFAGTKADADGRFEIERCAVGRVQVQVIDGATKWRSPVLLVDADLPQPWLHIVVPYDARPAFFHCRLIVPTERKGPSLRLHREGTQQQFKFDCDELGDARIGPLPEGKYTVTLSTAEGQTLDLGTRHLAAGTNTELGDVAIAK